MATHRRTPSRGRLLSFAAMLAALAVGLSVADPAPPLPPPDRPLLGAGRAAADGNAAPVPVVAAPVRAQVQRLLSQRAAAVRSGDARAYRASADGSAAERFRFGRLAALPVRTWAYRVGSLQPGRGGTEVSAVLAYRLRGEAASAQVPVRLLLTGVPGQLLVHSERTAGARRQPWEVGPLRAVAGARSLVIGVGRAGGDSDRLRDWASAADDAVGRVRAVLPGGWRPRVVVVVPSRSRQVAALTGRSRSQLERIAAVTVAETARTDGRPAATRVLLNTPLLARLTRTGRDILLRHEVTHVATGAPASSATPLWLEEGLAEYVGYRGSGVPLAVVTGDLAAAVPAGRAPPALPTPDRFDGTDPAVGYEAAYLACRVLAEQVGERGLVRVYRRTAAGDPATPAANLSAALRAVTGRGTAALTAALRVRLAQL